MTWIFRKLDNSVDIYIDAVAFVFPTEQTGRK